MLDPSATRHHGGPSPSRRAARLAVIGLVAALGLFGLRAVGQEPDGVDDPAGATPGLCDGGACLDPDAGGCLDGDAGGGCPGEAGIGQAAEDVEEGAEGGGEEGQIATFPVPSFANLAPIPSDRDWLARATLKDGRLVVEPEPSAEQKALADGRFPVPTLLPVPVPALGEEGAQARPPRVLTIDPLLQKRLTGLLKSYEVPFGAVVAIEPATGRVLALAEHSQENPAMRGLPVKAVYPAASVFKVVTGAALLARGVPAGESVCFHGGKRRLAPRLLEDSPRDGRCATFAQAMGSSYNVVFAKLARKSLEPSDLRAWAARFGFNAPLAFDEPTDVSVANVPDDEFGMANAAAGFGEVFLSPLHGALLAAAVGNRGVMMSPVLFEGEVATPRRVLDPSLAQALSDMLELTVTEGTARAAFRERGRSALGRVRAAGKTGSLNDKKPFRDFTWFVGYAPKENPTVAVAAVVVNGPYWRVRAPYVGREALRLALTSPGQPRERSARSGVALRDNSPH